MKNAADYYEHGVPIAVRDISGVEREYVPAAVYQRVVKSLQSRLAETVAFARAHGLTDEQWEVWKAGQ